MFRLVPYGALVLSVQPLKNNVKRENASALFVVEVYCSGAKSKVILRSELTL